MDIALEFLSHKIMELTPSSLLPGSQLRAGYQSKITRSSMQKASIEEAAIRHLIPRDAQYLANILVRVNKAACQGQFNLTVDISDNNGDCPSQGHAWDDCVEFLSSLGYTVEVLQGTGSSSCMKIAHISWITHF